MQLIQEIQEEVEVGDVFLAREEIKHKMIIMTLLVMEIMEVLETAAIMMMEEMEEE